MVNQIFNPNQIHNGVKAFIKAHFFIRGFLDMPFDFYSIELFRYFLAVRKQPALY